MEKEKKIWVHDHLQLVRIPEYEGEHTYYMTGEHKLYLQDEEGKRYEITKGIAAKLSHLFLDHILDSPNSLWEP